MELRISLKGVTMNVSEIMGLVRGPVFGTFAATEWLRLYHSYMPYAPVATTIKPWKIIHSEPYSQYDYFGNVMGPNVTTDGGETWFSPKIPKYLTGRKLRFAKGSDHWDQKAIPTQQPKLVQSLQAFIDSGRLF